jgi:hypothetical protein
MSTGAVRLATILGQGFLPRWEGLGLPLATRGTMGTASRNAEERAAHGKAVSVRGAGASRLFDEGAERGAEFRVAGAGEVARIR